MANDLSTFVTLVGSILKEHNVTIDEFCKFSGLSKDIYFKMIQGEYVSKENCKTFCDKMVAVAEAKGIPKPVTESPMAIEKQDLTVDMCLRFLCDKGYEVTIRLPKE